MQRKKIARYEDIPEGGSTVVYDGEGREIALFKVEGKIYALNNLCPHMEGPLGEGALEGCFVTCPWHGWQFDVRDGSCENMPGEDVKRYKVEVEEGDVFLV